MAPGKRRAIEHGGTHAAVQGLPAGRQSQASRAQSATAMKPKVNVELQQGCSVATLPDKLAVRRWIQAAIDAADSDDGRACEVVVRIVDEAESSDLNRRFRKKDGPTNVLAFPADERAPPGLDWKTTPARTSTHGIV